MKKFTPYLALTILLILLTPQFTNAQFSTNWYDVRDLGSYTAGRLCQAYYDSGTGETILYTAAVTGTFDGMNITRRTSEGDIVWSNDVSETGYSSWSPSAMHIDDAGNVIVSGQLYNTTEMRYELFIRSYNSGGGINWTRLITDDDSYTYFIGMEADPGGENVFIASWTYNYVGPTYTSELRLYSIQLSDGGIEWNTVYEAGDSYTYIYDMTASSTGVYFTGYMQDEDFSYDLLTVAFDTEGNLEWTNLYEADTAFEFNFGYAIDVNNSGDIIVGGSSGTGRTVIIRYHPDGTQLSSTEKNFGETAYIGLDMLMKDNGDGSTYFAASIYKNGEYSIYVTRLNEDGTPEWEKKANSQYLVDLEVPASGEGCFVVGSEYVHAVLNYVPALFMYSPTGNVVSETLVPLRGYYAIADMSTLTGTEFYFEGQKQTPSYANLENTSRWDVDSVMRLANITDKNMQVYPNPATDFVYVSTQAENAQIALMDIGGRSIQNYNGSNELQLDIRNISAGVYMLKIYADGIETIKQLIIE